MRIIGYDDAFYVKESCMDYQSPTEGLQQSSQASYGAMNVDLALMSSAALARLAEEVKNESLVGGNYDRVHNRHNR